METQTCKISISVGLLAMVILHAFLMRAPLPTMQSQSNVADRSFSFDTIQQSIANPNASQINVTARDEAKRQVSIDCIPCAQLQLPVQPKSQADQVKTQAKPPGKYYSIDVFVGSDQQSQALLNAFNSEPLKSLAAKCNFQVYAPGDQLYKQRYSQWIPASQFPAIVMTRQDGGHVFIASQAELPNTASAIHSAIRSATESSVKAEQLAKQANPVESSPDCVDGTCKKPPFFDRQPRDEPSLFPLRQPDSTELITGFFRSQGIGLESVGLLVLAAVIIILIFKQR